jgi:hypothetical protein
VRRRFIAKEIIPIYDMGVFKDAGFAGLSDYDVFD